MNLFILDKDPWIAAKYHCDQHVLKIAIEVAQILNVNSLFFGGESYVREYSPFKPYLSTHVNHPCTVWARKTFGNFLWTFEYGMALCVEYHMRYGKVRNVQKAIEWVGQHGTWPKKKSACTPFVLCMPDEYKTNDPVESYKNFYIKKKSKFARWLHNKPPLWYIEGIKNNA